MSVEHSAVVQSNALSYYQQRMLEIGCTEQNNIIKLCNPEGDHPANLPTNFQIFNEYQGNVEILFYNLKRELFPYLKFGTGKTGSVNAKSKFYKITRVAKPAEGFGKYKFPEAQGTNLKEQGIKNPPFLPPSLVEAYESKKEIPRLILTEGAFKAFRASEIAHIPTVGGTSITHFFDNEGKLHNDILELIYTCNVKEVMILWDGDCRTISEKVLNDTYLSEPLNRRPLGFYNAARKIRDAIFAQNKERKEKLGEENAGHLVEKVFFAHINKDKPKGLDDLLNEVKNDKEVSECVMNSKSNQYFTIFDITESVSEIHRHFKLNDVQSFYDFHHKQIKSKKFRFNDDTYEFSNEESALKLLEPGWAKRMYWIGDVFFEEVVTPSPNGGERTFLDKREIGTLKKLYSEDFEDYLKQRYCTGFCNYPSHTQYERILMNESGQRFYNRYHPIAFSPKPGDCPYSLMMVQHIFGTGTVKHPETGQVINEYDLGLDYIQMLLTRPTRILPVLCLVSEENRTGKSTFCDWLRWIFKDNAIKVNNNDFKSDFNEQFADKLLIVCEETLLDKKADSERIKDMSMSKDINVNVKNQRQFTIDFFGKFIFCSNNRRMIHVNKHDDRYWMRYIHPHQGKEISDLYSKLKSEVDCFIHFLMNRKMVCSDEGRSFFKKELYMTDTLAEAVTINEPGEASNIKEFMRDSFDENEDCPEIEMTLKEIRDLFFSKKDSDKWIKEVLKNMNVFLEMENGKLIGRRGKYTRKIRKEVRDEAGQLIGLEEIPITIHTRGNHYMFKRDQFASKDYLDKEKKEIQDFEAVLNLDKSDKPCPF